MSTSIRTRLLLWMVGGMSLLLALFALAVYGTLVRSLVASFDAVLLSTARAVCSNVEREGDTIRVEIDEKQMPEFHRAEKPDYFELWRADGAVLARSPSIRDRALERFDGPPEVPVFRSIRLPDGRAGRAVSLLFSPVPDDGSKEATPAERVTLVVARETAAIQSVAAQPVRAAHT